MDSKEKFNLKKSYFNTLFKFSIFLSKLSLKQRIKYFSKIPKRELKLITEITVNLLQSNIPVPFEVFKLLGKVKDIIRMLADISISDKKKREVLTGLRGSQYISLILPYLKSLLKQ